MKIRCFKAYDQATNKLSLFLDMEKRMVCVPWNKKFNDHAGRKQFAMDMLLRGCGLFEPVSEMKRMMPGSFGMIDEFEISKEALRKARDEFLSSEGQPFNFETELRWHHPF